MMMVLRLEDNDDGDVERDNCDNDDDFGLENEREGGCWYLHASYSPFD